MSKEVTRDEFVQAVYLTLYDHPEWFQDVIMATQQATLDKLDEHSTKRARAEGALSLAYPYLKVKAERKLGGAYEQALNLARDVLLASSEGTEFGSNLRAEIEKEKEYGP